jgi:hypothetical protein
MFPRPEGYIPDRYMEHKNFINYPGLVELCKQRNDKSIWEIDGLAEALPALEAQRKRDLEDWMDAEGIDVVVFPANGDVGKADLEYNDESAKHALQNGVKYSNGNRAIRHMGVPTVSVPMGLMATTSMPVNLTFAGKHGQDSELLKYACAFEAATKRRTRPPVTPQLPSDGLPTPVAPLQKDQATGFQLSVSSVSRPNGTSLELSGRIEPYPTDAVKIEAFVDGKSVTADNVVIEGDHWVIAAEVEPFEPKTPLYGGIGEVVGNFNVVILGRCGQEVAGFLSMIPQTVDIGR